MTEGAKGSVTEGPGYRNQNQQLQDPLSPERIAAHTHYVSKSRDGS